MVERERKRPPSECDPGCKWRPDFSKSTKITHRCEEHGGVFPCRDKWCGHSDCVDVRGEPAVCYACKKPIAPGEQQRKLKLGRSRWYHPDCEV